jgi:hypothetical protein
LAVQHKPTYMLTDPGRLPELLMLLGTGFQPSRHYPTPGVPQEDQSPRPSEDSKLHDRPDDGWSLGDYGLWLPYERPDLEFDSCNAHQKAGHVARQIHNLVSQWPRYFHQGAYRIPVNLPGSGPTALERTLERDVLLRFVSLSYQMMGYASYFLHFLEIRTSDSQERLACLVQKTRVVEEILWSSKSVQAPDGHRVIIGGLPSTEPKRIRQVIRQFLKAAKLPRPVSMPFDEERRLTDQRSSKFGQDNGFAGFGHVSLHFSSITDAVRAVIALTPFSTDLESNISAR